VSLQYSLAEALTHGSLGKTSYRAESLRNPAILTLARRVSYYVDPAYPGPGRFKGEVKITLKDGRIFQELEEYNRGSAENPMTYEEIRAKFDENASGFLSASRRDKVAILVRDLEMLGDASELVRSACVRSASPSDGPSRSRSF
jgi:2-methylcitrate dehydratase PrpD